MLTIDAQLKSGELSRFHLLYGEETYLIRNYKNRLKAALTVPGDDMNASYFEGEKISLEEVQSIGNTLPFFHESRFLLLENTQLFKKSNDMVEMIEQFPETTYVIFVEKQVDKRNRFYKWIQKNGCVTECGLRSEVELVPWIAKYFAQYKKKISRSTAEFIVSRVGFQMDMLASELEKLLGYMGEREVVTEEDVEAICSGQTVGKLFEMMDAVIAGEQEKVFALYADLLELKEPPLKILHMLGRHINILLQVKEGGRSLSDRDLAAKIGIPFFTIKKYRNQEKHFTKDTLMSLLEMRVDLEERFKTGRMQENLIAEIFLTKALTNISKNGTNK